MIGIKTSDGVEYITKLEHFRGLMPDETYEGLTEYISKLLEDNADHISYLQGKVGEANESAADAESDYENLVLEVMNLKEYLKEVILTQNITKKEMVRLIGNFIE